MEVEGWGVGYDPGVYVSGLFPALSEWGLCPGRGAMSYLRPFGRSLLSKKNFAQINSQHGWVTLMGQNFGVFPLE